MEEEVPDFTHELTVSWLIGVLRTWLAGRGFVVGSELKLLVGNKRGRKPDLRTASGNYEKLVGVTEGLIDPVPGCSGLMLNVDALWAELARLSEP